jgi:hypothetical protein
MGPPNGYARLAFAWRAVHWLPRCPYCHSLPPDRAGCLQGFSQQR